MRTRYGLRTFLVATDLLAAVLAQGCGEDQPAGPPLLWQATDPQGNKAYLLGSLHLGVNAHADLGPGVWDALGKASGFCGEAEVRNISDQEYAYLARIPAGTTLDQLLPEATWNKLLTILEDASSSSLRQLRPWVVGGAIYQRLAPSAEPLDVTLLSWADDQGKTLNFFETWQYQISILNTIPLEEAAAGLVDLIENLESYRAAVAALIAAYRAGDVAEVERLGVSAGAVPARESPYYETLITNRNEAWLPQLTALLSPQGQFVTVGFGHVIGEGGLVDLLAKQGYSILPIK